MRHTPPSGKWLHIQLPKRPARTEGLRQHPLYGLHAHPIATPHHNSLQLTLLIAAAVIGLNSSYVPWPVDAAPVRYKIVQTPVKQCHQGCLCQLLSPVPPCISQNSKFQWPSIWIYQVASASSVPSSLQCTIHACLPTRVPYYAHRPTPWRCWHLPDASGPGLAVAPTGAGLVATMHLWAGFWAGCPHPPPA